MTLDKLQEISSRLHEARADRAERTSGEVLAALIFTLLLPGLLLVTWGLILAIAFLSILIGALLLYIFWPGIYKTLSLSLFKANWSKSEIEILQVEPGSIERHEFLIAAQTYILEQASKELDEETLYAFNKLAPNYHGTISELIETSKSLTS